MHIYFNLIHDYVEKGALIETYDCVSEKYMGIGGYICEPTGTAAGLAVEIDKVANYFL